MASSKVNPSPSASAKVNNGLLPTPPMPEGLPKANLTDNARQVLVKRYVRRSGAAYEGASDKDDIGGVAGAALGFRLGGMLSLYVAADDYIYGTRIDETTFQADKTTQNDVHLSVGFGFPLGR